MHFDVLSIFPEFFASPLQEGIIRRAQAAQQVAIAVHNIRDYAVDKHHMTDDRPFGGGEGMVMKPEPLAGCIQDLALANSESERVILLSPRGSLLTQAKAQQLAELSRIVLVCGRYEGVDERFRQRYVDEELSIGDYVLTGGELAALVVIDTVTRLCPGVLGCEDSATQDSFSCGLLKHGQYTRPRVFEDLEVPAVLFSGDHAAVAQYRFVESVRLTLERRPDLLLNMEFSKVQRKMLRQAGLLEQVNERQAKGQEG